MKLICRSFGMNAIRSSIATLVISVCTIASSGIAQASNTYETSSDQTPALEEVVVTAEKREERLQDVPVPVSAIDAATLINTNQVSLTQYYSTVPSLNFTPSAFGGGTFTIRGLNSGGGSSTVAVMVDGVPFGTSSAIANNYAIPDLDPGILQRVEVLRGPQGTLYGSGSIGGVVNFITLDPAMDTTSGRVQADMNSVDGGNGLGYGFRGSVNVPLSDTLAIRASAFTRYDPGYINNVETGQGGVNWDEVAGGRLAARWQPSEIFTLRLSAMLQDNYLHGDPQVFIAPGFGDLQQAELRDAEYQHSKTQDFSVNANLKLGRFDLTSISSWNTNSLATGDDFTTFYAGLTQPIYGANIGAASPALADTEKFVEEFRLSTSFGKIADWLLGAYYSHEASHTSELVNINDLSTGAFLSNFSNQYWSSTYAEYAAFTDLTFHLTDHFQIQFGGRESFYKQEYNEIDSGPYVPAYEGVPTPAIYPVEHTSQNAFTYLVTPEFKVSDDFMVYARLASGYRPGGPNFNDVGAVSKEIPTAFGSDTTKNYEIGTKGDVFDHMLTFDVSLYYIDWKNIQLFLFNTAVGLGYLGNAGEAKSEGTEVSLTLHPTQDLTISAWGTWDEAELTEPFPPIASAYGVAGDPLPFAARASGYSSVEQQFPLSDQWRGFVGAAETYVGKRLGGFLSGPPSVTPRQEYPAYAKTDLRAGARQGSWTLNLFANNVTNKRGILSGGINNAPNSNAFYIIQPRTVGLSATKTF
jgi:iron complex outermembrane receptor protein